MQQQITGTTEKSQSQLPSWINYQLVILLVAVSTQAAAGSTNQGVPVLASFYQTDLHLSSTEVGLFTAALIAGTLIVGLPAGFATYRFGVRVVLFLGQLMMGSSIVLLSMMPSFGFAVIFAFLAGCSHSFTNPAIAKGILYWFPLKRRATAMGIKQTGIPISGALAAIILPAVALAFNWRFAMLTLGLVVMVSGFVSLALYRHCPASTLQHANRRLNFGAAKEVLKNKNTWVICAMAATLVGGQYCIVTYLILYLRDVFQMSPPAAGGYLAVVQISGLVARLLLGAVSDFALGGRRKVILIGCGVVGSIALLSIGMLDSGADPLLLISVMPLLGVSVVGWNGIWVTMMAESNSVEMAGMSMGLGSSLITIGGITFPALFGFIIDSSGSYRVAWLVSGLFLVLGTLLLFFLGKERRANVAEA